MPARWLLLLYAGAALAPSAILASQQYLTPELLPPAFTAFQDDRDPKCPPCFNCNLENYKCLQTGNCTSSTGQCSCPPGFGDIDCSQPLCGSLAQGDDRPVRPEPDAGKRPECECEDGWEGINCNVCTTNEACGPLMPEGAEEGDAKCYKQGLVQRENFQMCDVTNKKVIEGLKNDGIPQVTFSCNAAREDCNFQFWIGGLESFYCGLQDCRFSFEAQDNRNITKYTCDHVQCSCISGRKLCEENGVNIGPLLEDEIKGPAAFKTSSTEGGSAEDGSIFTEKKMDELISGVFGDDSIFLQCKSGECLYKTSVPGFEKPLKKINTPLIAGIIAGCGLFVVGLILLVWYLSRRTNSRKYGAIHVGDGDQDEMLMVDHKPATLHFENVSYAVNGKQILNGVQGAVRPGELLAIMGASGAGKTTFLDILARKNKKGVSQGNFYVNGDTISDRDFRSVIGFVDQDDIMLPTLTVHETILDSAMLRLPADMSLAAKEQKVEDVEKQLGIFHIRDSIIGSEEVNGRGISGGEKRRVGIACELITSPSILFLDEPTSGLDAYNAYNVIECLVTLVKTYHRTVVFTIHQPRSNIVALFDQLILLARGRTVYSGPFSSCQSYFDGIGYTCPPGFNIADYLIDLTMHAGESRSPMDDIIAAEAGDQTRSSSIMAIKSIASRTNMKSTNDMNGSPGTNSIRPSMESGRGSVDVRRSSIKEQQDRQLFHRRKRTGAETPDSQVEEEQLLLDNAKEPAKSWLRLSKQTGNVPPQIFDDPRHLPPTTGADGTDLDNLIASYYDSDVAQSVTDDIREAVSDAKTPNGTQDGESLPPRPPSMRMRGYRKVGLLGQFAILSVRTWRNLYRNPMLMLTHYAIAILLAVFLGFLFYGVTDNIAGFQNRLGLFFFVLALFGFGTLTSLTTFAQERLLFVRERAKGYYRPLSYFAAKVVFDIVPLRLIPPILLGAIVYPMTGLVPTWTEFVKFIAFLILFNFAAAAICLFLGIIFRNGGVANLIGSLTMLFSLLFSGFLLNKDSIPKAVLWLQVLSIFHYGFEGLIVNEVRYLSLIDHKYGLDIEVPGAVILTTFGFNVTSLYRDMLGLGVVAAAFLVLGYVAMHLLLVERR